jgi:PAS domain S-box-containing protein
MFGYTLDELSDIDTWIRKAYPDAEYRKRVIEPWRSEIKLAYKLGIQPPELESEITCKDGRKRYILTRISWVGEKRLANFTDITAHWQSEKRNRAHNAILEMVARAESLNEILHAIVRTIEEEDPASICSILLLDKEGKHLLTAAAPALPSFYNEAIEGLEIGMGVGSCGTAAYLGKRVIVEDISAHEYWESFTELAEQAGLAACWSEPIISSEAKVLGTFAIYYGKPTTPGQNDIERITFAANLAAIAIENRKTRGALIRRERDFRTLAENAPINIARYDLSGHLVYVNPRLEATFSLPKEKLLGKGFSQWPDMPYAAALQKALTHTRETGEETSFEAIIPRKEGDNETHIISIVAERDETGAITGLLATGLDISDRKRLEEQLAAREHLFRTLADNAPINIARYDRNGCLIYANRRLAETFPAPVEQILGKKLTDLPGLQFAAPFQKAIEHTLESGKENSFEATIPTASGSETHIITMVVERD